MYLTLVWVMLASIIAATRVAAEPLAAPPIDPFAAGLGPARRELSDAQLAVRTDRLAETTTFALLRFPDALEAPTRIFDPDIWPHIERASAAHDLDPMLLAGMIFIESYGDPRAKSPTGPAGIAQLTRASAREMGLTVGKRVRTGSTTVTRTRWVGKGANRRKVVQKVRRPVYRTIDERYVPSRAIMAMAKRVDRRRDWLGGKLDFAVAEYHMGAGRMARLLSAYFGETVRVGDVPSYMRGASLSYSELFFANTPYYRREVFDALDDLNRVDFSPTYYFRVRQAMRLLETWRQSPDEYLRIASTHQGRFGWTVLPSSQWSFVSEPIAIPPDGAVPPPLFQGLSTRFVLLPDLASRFGVHSTAQRIAAERSTIGAALFVADQLRQLQGDRFNGFEISRMLAHEPVDEDGESTPLHSLGWAFDVPVSALSPTDQRDLKFVLTDLRHAGLIAYIEDRRRPTFHVVRHPDHAGRFEQYYQEVMTRGVTGDAPRQAAMAGPPAGTGLLRSHLPRLVVALSGLFSRVYSFFDAG